MLSDEILKLLKYFKEILKGAKEFKKYEPDDFEDGWKKFFEKYEKEDKEELTVQLKNFVYFYHYFYSRSLLM